MIPSFVPLIGRDFDSLGAQQLQWAGFSRGVEEDNFRRAAAAESARNNYFENLANMQVRQQSRADAMAEREATVARENNRFDLVQQTRRADRAEDIRRSDKELREGLALEREKIKARENYFQAKQEEDLNNSGSGIAASYSQSRLKIQNADKALKDATAEYTSLNEQASSKSADKDFLRSLNNAKKNVAKAQSIYNRATEEHQGIIGEAKASGFEIDDESGKIKHGKREWGFAESLKKVKSEAPEFQPAMGGRAMADAASMPTETGSSGQPYEGFQTASANANNPNAVNFFARSGESAIPESVFVSVVNPKGKPVRIRRAQLQDALTQGYTER